MRFRGRLGAPRGRLWAAAVVEDCANQFTGRHRLFDPVQKSGIEFLVPARRT
jgi:hypothetical protein